MKLERTRHSALSLRGMLALAAVLAGLAPQGCSPCDCYYPPRNSRTEAGVGCDARPCVTHADCDDLRRCNGVERCGADGCCVPGTPVLCVNAAACARGACAEVYGACIWEYHHEECSALERCVDTLGCVLPHYVPCAYVGDPVCAQLGVDSCGVGWDCDLLAARCTARTRADAGACD